METSSTTSNDTDSRGSKSMEKGFTRKRSKSIVAAVKSFFGRQLSKDEAPELQDDSDSSSKSEPQESKRQDEAWMQACLNAIALLFLFITGCMLVAVYYILEPFLHPLLWAVLVGMVLHPFKYISTSGITQWLQYVRKSGVPLSLAAVFTPLFLFNWFSQKLEHIALKSWKVVTGLALGVIVLLLMYVLSFPIFIYKVLTVLFHSFGFVESLLTTPLYVMFLSLTAGFFLLLLLTKGQSKYAMSLKILSSILWYLLILNLSAYLLGSLAIPLVTILFVSAVILSVTWKKKPRSTRNDREAEKCVYDQGDYLSTLSSVTSFYDEGGASNEKTQIEMERKDAGKGAGPSMSAPLKGYKGMRGQGSGSHKDVIHEEAGIERVAGRTSFGTVEAIHEKRISSDKSSEVGSGHHKSGRIKHLYHRQAKEKSNSVFVVLLIAYFIVMLWKYPLFLFVLMPLALWASLKHAFSLSSTFGTRVRLSISRTASVLRERAWLIAPTPLPTLLRMFLYADRVILQLAVRSTGSLVSSFIIIGLVVGLATAVVLLLLEVQVELTHYMAVGAKVWNMTLASNPQLSEWLHSSKTNESLTFSFEVFAEQSYQYGRVWLAQKLHSLVGDSKQGGSLVEKQILDLFDELYHSYFLREAPVSDSLGNMWKESSSGASRALFAEVKVLIFDNLETILSVLQSLGSIITDNLSVALSFLYALLHLLFSGGSALLNMVVFVSTLFYLLSWSDEQYLPVQWVMELLPHLTPVSSSGEEDEVAKEQGEAFQRAIRSVFHASFRRAAFYSLYTWLTHTLVAIPVSILPSVLAGVAGAIPFVGPYWVSLPAILELWLIESRPLAAIVLLVISLLPVLFVDSLINGEIEGGHPYLTGLAIAGGIYFAGLEGALIGPILLCCLLFFMDMYGDIFSTPTSS